MRSIKLHKDIQNECNETMNCSNALIIKYKYENFKPVVDRYYPQKYLAT